MAQSLCNIFNIYCIIKFPKQPYAVGFIIILISQIYKKRKNKTKQSSLERNWHTDMVLITQQVTGREHKAG